MNIHHIGYAVASVEKSRSSFEAMGYVAEGDCTDDAFRKVRILFMTQGSYRIELIAPLEAGSPVDKIVRQNGPTPYHLCYEVENIDLSLPELKKNGFKPITGADPAPAIGGRRVMFLMSLRQGLIELVEKGI